MRSDIFILFFFSRFKHFHAAIKLPIFKYLQLRKSFSHAKIQFYYMYFSRLFYFHLISHRSVLKHFLRLNTKANTLQYSFTIPSEWTSYQARQCSVSSDPLPRWQRLPVSCACLLDPQMPQMPQMPCWHLLPTLLGTAFTLTFVSSCSILGRNSWRHGRSVWGGSAPGNIGSLSVNVPPMRVTLHWAAPNMTPWHFI